MRKHVAALLGIAVIALASPAHATVNAQTGTAYTFLNSDCDPQSRTVVTFNNAAATAVTLPQSGALGAFTGDCRIRVENIGGGVVTITPATSTINGTTTYVLPSKSSVDIANDATATATGNYWAMSGSANFYGHAITSGPAAAPALTSCGTTPAITGTDTAGIVTLGTTATGCVITFNQAYTAAPFCVVTWIATPLASQSYVTASTTITLTQTSASNNKVQYVCVAQAGG
jgi:hypothetical protein